MIFKGLKSSFQYRYKRVFYISMVVLLILPSQTYTKDLCRKLFINIRNKVFSGQSVRADTKSKTKPKTPRAFAEAMTQGLFLGEKQADLLELYLKNWFGDFNEKINKDKYFTLLFQILEKYPELSKPSLREQILEISIKEYEQSQSLIQFIQNFKKSSKRRRNNLFQIEANIGFWHKILDFQEAPPSSNLKGQKRKEWKQKQMEGFKDYFKKFISEENLKFIENSSIPYREKIIGFYKILNEARDQLLADKRDVRYISQAMVDLVDTAGFGNPLYEASLKSKNPIERIDAVRKILSERNVIAIELGFEGHFSELRESLNVKPNEDISTQLLRIEDDIKNQPYKEGYRKTLRLRSLSIQESPFRSCLSGDCATEYYFEKALDPNYLYFTLTGENYKSSGHIAVVLGSAENERGEKEQVAFVDKIQDFPNHLLLPTLEGIRLSLKELGYKLGLPKNVGDHNDISNDDITRGYLKEKILPQLKVRLRKFQPHPNEYPFENEYSDEYSRADQGLDMLVLEEEGRGLDNITIRPGEIYIPQTASEELSVRGLYEPVLSLGKSNETEDQIKFLNNLLSLKEIEGLNITSEYVKSYLKDKIEGQDIDSRVRKLTLFTLIQWELKKRINLELGKRVDVDLDFLSTQLELFSKKEQQVIIGEMSNWKDVRVFYKREFIRQISQVFFSENEQQIEEVLNSKFKILLDINARSSFSETALMYAAKKGDREFVDFLLARGADIDAKNRWGETALIQAAEEGDREFVDFLLARGADIDATNINGYTALMYAAGKGNLDIAELLVESGANKNAKSKNGQTALMYAARHGYLKIVELLVESGANKNSKNKYGHMALDFAKKNTNGEYREKFIQLLK